MALCEGNPPVTGEFTSQRPVARSLGAFFKLRLNNGLSKQWRRRWFETPSRSLWRQSNEFALCCVLLWQWPILSISSIVTLVALGHLPTDSCRLCKTRWWEEIFIQSHRCFPSSNLKDTLIENRNWISLPHEPCFADFILCIQSGQLACVILDLANVYEYNVCCFYKIV